MHLQEGKQRSKMSENTRSRPYGEATIRGTVGRERVRGFTATSLVRRDGQDRTKMLGKNNLFQRPRLVIPRARGGRNYA